MKKVFLIILIIIVVIPTVKSQVFIGGQFNTSFSSNDTRNETYIEFSPHAGYFIRDNMAAGGRIIYNLAKMELKNNDNDTKYRGFGLGGFYRQYIETGDDIRFFGHAYSDLVFLKTKNFTGEDKSTSLIFGVKPALSIGLTDYLNLEIMFGDLSFGILFDGGDNTVDFNLNINEIGFGLSYVINR